MNDPTEFRTRETAAEWFERMGSIGYAAPAVITTSPRAPYTLASVDTAYPLEEPDAYRDIARERVMREQYDALRERVQRQMHDEKNAAALARALRF